MGFNKFLKIRTLLPALLFGMLLVGSPVSAQHEKPETAEAVATVAADTAKQATATADTVSASAAPDEVKISTDVAADDELAKLETAQTQDNSEAYKTGYYYLLLFVLLCVFIGIVGKVLKVYELSRNVQGKSGGINWNVFQAVLFVIFLVIGLYGSYWSYDYWGYVVTTEAASYHGVKLDNMLLWTIGITTVVFVLTQILLFGFAYLYKGSDKRKAYYYPHNNAIERAWTIVPAIVLTVLVVFGFTTWRSITNPTEEAIKGAINLEVTGEQFKWNIRYSGADNTLGKKNYKLTTPTNGLGIDFTDKASWDDKLAGEIVLPKDRAVRVTINSKDILHSFYLPDFRVQMNAVPGMPTYFQFTPRLTTKEIRNKRGDQAYNYILLCAKICGAGHYNMQYKVTVVEPKEYEEWLVKQSLYYTDDVKKELQSAQKNAAAVDNKLAINN